MTLYVALGSCRYAAIAVVVQSQHVALLLLRGFVIQCCDGASCVQTVLGCRRTMLTCALLLGKFGAEVDYVLQL
jgi:hypothetical protein